MSTSSDASRTAVSSTLIERTGIEIIPDSERTAKPRDLFWPWFAANVSVFGMSYGSFVLGFGISFWQATIVSIVGIVVSFFLCGLIAIEPDLGTMVLCAAVAGTMLFVAGVRHLYVWPLVGLASTVLSVVVLGWENRRNRVISFLYPEEHKQGVGYQLWQGMRGFACGGTDGAGLGNGMQQEAFLPEAHTDFIFAIVGEELGLWFTLGVAAAFLAFFALVVSHLPRQQDVFRFNICLGAMLFIVYQALINMGVVTGLLPTKGMSLPFISYGGTNILMMFALVGLILNCMRTGSRLSLAGPREIP